MSEDKELTLSALKTRVDALETKLARLEYALDSLSDEHSRFKDKIYARVFKEVKHEGDW